MGLLLRYDEVRVVVFSLQLKGDQWKAQAELDGQRIDQGKTLLHAWTWLWTGRTSITLRRLQPRSALNTVCWAHVLSRPRVPVHIKNIRPFSATEQQGIQLDTLYLILCQYQHRRYETHLSSIRVPRGEYGLHVGMLPCIVPWYDVTRL